MAAILLPQLSIDLPSSRMSVNFATFTLDPSAHLKTPTHTYKQHLIPRKPVQFREIRNEPRTTPYQSSLAGVKEERSMTSESPLQEMSSERSWNGPDLTQLRLQSDNNIYALSRNNSSASSTSTASVAAESTFSTAQASYTPRTSYDSSFEPQPHEPLKNKAPNLTTLPLSLLEDILAYALALPLTVSIGPGSRHMLYRYHRAAMDYVELRQIMNHPLFLVSRHIRETTLDVFYQRCDFSVDLASIYYTNVASTVEDNLKKQLRFWTFGPPKVVRDTLQSILKLYIRVPVPTTEERTSPDEGEWMESSNNKGRAKWKVKSMRSEHEDASRIRMCLETVLSLVTVSKTDFKPSQGLTRSTSGLTALQQLKSAEPERSESAEHFSTREDSISDLDEPAHDRESLKRLEVTLIKRSPDSVVLAETLGLIRALRSVPVTGFTKYWLELSGEKTIFAIKYRKKWHGEAPDGDKLLNGLQYLTVDGSSISRSQTSLGRKAISNDKSGLPQTNELTSVKAPMALNTMQGSKRYLHAWPLPQTSTVLNNVQNVDEYAQTNSKDIASSEFHVVSEPPKSSKKDSSGNSSQEPDPPLRRKRSRSLFRKKSHRRLDSSSPELSRDVTTNRSFGGFDKKEPPTVEELRQIAEDIRKGLY